MIFLGTGAGNGYLALFKMIFLEYGKPQLNGLEPQEVPTNKLT